jgi:hypothetical protein
MLRKLRVGMTLLAGVAACNPITVDRDDRPPQRMLFIGNSLTSENNLPALVKALAEAGGHPALTIGTDVLDGTNLADHWNGLSPAAIDQGWDIVVLQQGPTSRSVDRVELRMMAARFADRIRANGGQPALYMVWPQAELSTSFAAISHSYRAAAEDVNGYLYPVGEAWLEIWRRNLSMPLYGSDNFHPSAYGTYAAALTIVGVTWRRSTVGLPGRFLLPGGTSIWINPLDARVMQESVDEAIRVHGRRPR